MATLWPIVVISLVLAAFSDAVSLRDKNTPAYVKKDWKIYAIMALAMAVFVGLRTRGNDTFVYRSEYEKLGTGWDSIVGINWLRIAGAPGLQCYGIILKTLGASTQDYLMMTALITVSIYLWFIRKYTCNIFLSIFYFITMGAYTFTMAAIKQTMAVAFLLLATDRAIQKKWVSYLLWVMFAELFHPYAFIYLIVPFVAFRPWSKGTIYLLAGAVAVALFMSRFISAIDSVTEALGYNYSEDSFVGEGVNIFRVLVVWVPLVLSFLGRRQLRQSDDRAANIIVNLMMLNAAIMFIGLFGTANYFARLANYFLIFQVISLPRILQLFSDEDRKKITAISVVGFSAYFYYGSGIVHGGFDNNYSIMSLWGYVKQLFGR